MNVKELKSKIIHYNKLYRIGKSEIDDSVYDSMLDELENKMTIFEFESFKQSLAEESGTVKLDYVLGSLSKYKYEEPDKFYKWIKNYKIDKIFCSEKINGVSFVASYRNGKLVSCSSKGDSISGTNWNDKADYILPTKIEYKYDLDIRGEFVMYKQDSDKLGFKNPLNATIGIMNRDEINIKDLCYINAYVYEILSSKESIQHQFRAIEEIGFFTPKSMTLYAISDVHENIKEFYENCKINSSYDIDGIVCSDINYKNENIHTPKAKIAFKINTLTYPTKVLNIEWNVSKSNSLKPVLLVEPVIIDGTTVSRVTANNAQWVIDNGLGINAEILINKAGQIIPRCVSVTKKVKSNLPDNCPVCNSKTRLEGVELKCSNFNCSGSSVKSLESFIVNCGVENVSEKTLINWNIISFDDLLDFIPDNNYKSEIKFYNELKEKVFTKSKEELFSNLTFNGAGSTVINKLIDFYGNGNLDDAINNIYYNNKCDDKYPSGIGQKIIDKIENDCYHNLKLVDKFIHDQRYSFKEKVKKEKNIQSKIFGKSFCVTGTLSKTRNLVEADIIEAGGKISSSVTKTLDYLIAGENCGSKLSKAESYGVKIISEDQLNEMLSLSC